MTTTTTTSTCHIPICLGENRPLVLMDLLMRLCQQQQGGDVPLPPAALPPEPLATTTPPPEPAQQAARASTSSQITRASFRHTCSFYRLLLQTI